MACIDETGTRFHNKNLKQDAQFYAAGADEKADFVKREFGYFAMSLKWALSRQFLLLRFRLVVEMHCASSTVNPK